MINSFKNPSIRGSALILSSRDYYLLGADTSFREEAERYILSFGVPDGNQLLPAEETKQLSIDISKETQRMSLNQV